MALREIDVAAFSAAPPATRTSPEAPASPQSPEPAPAVIPAYRGITARTTPAGRRFWRFLEMAPGLLSWTIITALFWGALILPRPLAAVVLAFDLLWLYISATTAWNSLVSYRRLRRDEKIDWQEEHRVAAAMGRAYVAWDDVYHVVIFPNYKEPPAILRRALQSLAVQSNARQIYVVLAMEAREQGGGQKAHDLEVEFEGCFAGIFSTFHPAGLPNEVVGKSSNENWAARIAKRILVDEQGHDLRNLTVTSADADTVFHPAYFACLTHKFATDSNRHRRFWQSPILLVNNVWDAPAPIRVGSMMADVHILGNLSKGDRIVFPQSTYSLSLQMAHDVGYWDPDVIPEDWHMFLKCFYTFSGAVEVEPIYLPTGNDAVRAKGYVSSLVENYRQKVRHAWGAVDIPYATLESLAHTEMPAYRRYRRLLALTSNHLMWSTNWWLLTAGWRVPDLFRSVFSNRTDVHLAEAAGHLALTTCIVFYIAVIVIDSRLRPAKPAWWRPWHSATQLVMWFALPITGFFFSALPALVAQTRLLLGKRLEYRVTEKV